MTRRFVLVIKLQLVLALIDIVCVWPCAAAHSSIASSNSNLPPKEISGEASALEKQIEKGDGLKAPDLSEPANEVFKYVGNSFSGKFHRPWCPFEQAMDARNAVLFHFRRDAIAAGFIPCRYCLPPFEKRVKCVLLNHKPDVDSQPGVELNQ